MLHSRCQSLHLERIVSVKWRRPASGACGWVPVINTTVDGEDIAISMCREALSQAKGMGAERNPHDIQLASFL